MAFLLSRSGKKLVRLSISSSWAAKPTRPPLMRILTSVNNNNNNNNNCFSTAASSSPGGMIQESNLKDFLADPALKDLLFNCGQYVAKNMVNIIQNKPPPSSAEFHKFLDDQFKKLPPLDDETKDPASETDQVEKYPKATPELIKATLVFVDAVTGGLHKYLPRPAFKVKGDNFYFTLDTNRLDLTVNVSGLAKEHLVVWVVKDRVLVTSRVGVGVAPNQKVFESMLPEDYNYDPDEVTGTIMEDGQLKISFPVSKEGGEPKEKYFEVNLV